MILGRMTQERCKTTGFATILANDADVDGDAINVTAVNAITLGATVTWWIPTTALLTPTYDPVDSSTTIQTLAQGETLTDTVTYTITDEDAAQPTQQRCSYTVTGGDTLTLSTL